MVGLAGINNVMTISQDYWERQGEFGVEEGSRTLNFPQMDWAFQHAQSALSQKEKNQQQGNEHEDYSQRNQQEVQDYLMHTCRDWCNICVQGGEYEDSYEATGRVPSLSEREKQKADMSHVETTPCQRFAAHALFGKTHPF